MSSVTEFRLAVRALLRSPGYTAVAFTMFALGIGLAVFMFGAVNGYLLGTLPFPEPGRIVHVSVTEREGSRSFNSVPPRVLEEWQRGQSSFAALGGYFIGTMNLSGDDRPERYSGAFVTGQLFDVLRVPPLLGRTLDARDDRPGVPLVAVISAELWRHRYNEDPHIVGRRIRVNAQDAEIVGVMPFGFHFPEREYVWLPQRQDVASFVHFGNPYGGMWMDVVGRLRPGTTMAAARGDLQALYTGLLADVPHPNAEPWVAARTLHERYVSAEARQIILTLFASCVFVLLIACTNVANLTFGRVASRRREIAVRASLGAGRARIIGGVLFEVLLVALAGAAVGLMVGEWAGAAIDRMLLQAQESPPYWVDSSADWRVFAFTVLAAVAAALVAGFVPAWRATKGDLNAGLRDGGHGTSDAGTGRLTRGLVVFQVALCSVLLISAGLMLRSAMHLNAAEDGLGDRNQLTGRIGLFEAAYPDGASRMRVYERLQAELEAIPGVRAATVASALPLTGTGWTRYRRADAEYADASEAPSTRLAAVDPAYFDAFGVRLLRGRGLTAADVDGAPPVIVVNAAFAEREWPGADPIGRQVQLQYPNGPTVTVVGVVADFMQAGSDLVQGVQPSAYEPLAQNPVRFVSFAIAVDGDPALYANAVRDVMLRVEPDTPIYWLRTFAEVTSMATFMNRLMASLFGLFAACALLLAAAGLYAVLATGVSQRTREIGVRRALGAQDTTIVRMVVRQGGRQYAVGIAIGLAVAVLFAQLLTEMLVGVSPVDPLTYTVVAVVLGVVSFVAAWTPARRALRVQPMEALRYE